jgi:hypothetical protein
MHELRMSLRAVTIIGALASFWFSGAAMAIPKVVLNDGSVIGFAHPEAKQGRDGRIHIAVVGYDPTSPGECRSSGCDIYYMLLSAGGKVLIDATKVNSSATGEHGKPRIAVTSDNKAVISWHAGNQSTPEPLKYVLVDPSLNTNAVGAPMSASAIAVTETTVGTSTGSDSHDLALDGSGLAIAVLNASSSLRFVTWNPLTGAVVTAEKAIDASGSSEREPQPAIGVDSNDNVHIAFPSIAVDGNAPAGYMMVDNTGTVLIAPTALYDGSLGAVSPHASHFSLFVDGQDRVHITYGDKRNTIDANSWCNVCAQNGTAFYTVLDPGRHPQDGSASDMATLRVGKETTIGDYWYGRSFSHGGGVHFFTGAERGGRGSIVHGVIGMNGGLIEAPHVFNGTNAKDNSYYGRYTMTAAGGHLIWTEGVFNTPLLNGTTELVRASVSSFSTSTGGSGGALPPLTLAPLALFALAGLRRRRAH